MKVSTKNILSLSLLLITCTAQSMDKFLGFIPLKSFAQKLPSFGKRTRPENTESIENPEEETEEQKLKKRRHEKSKNDTEARTQTPESSQTSTAQVSTQANNHVTLHLSNLARFEEVSQLTSLTAGNTPVSQATSLTVITPTRTPITPEQIKILGQRFPHITELNLSRAGLTDQTVEILAQQSFAPYLQRVTLASNRITPEAIRNHLSKFTALTYLDLTYCAIQNAGLAALSELPFASQFISLILAGNEITADGIASMGNFTNLEQLDISNNTLGSRGLIALTGQPFASLINSLNIAEIGLESANSNAAIFAMENFSKLVELNISQNNIQNAGLFELANRSFAPNVRVLNIARNSLIYSQSFRNGMIRFAGLTSLNISFNELGDEGFEFIAGLVYAENIGALRVAQNNLTHHAMRFIGSFSSLTQLDVSHNEVGNAGLNIIANQSFAPLITYLNIINCGLADSGFFNAIARTLSRDFATSLRSFTALTQLAISWNYNIGDRGVEVIGNLPFAAQITHLEIDGNNLTDASINFMGVLTGLRALNLSRNYQITNAGLSSLAAQPFAAQLVSLGIRDIQITAEDFEREKNSFPTLSELDETFSHKQDN